LDLIMLFSRFRRQVRILVLVCVVAISSLSAATAGGTGLAARYYANETLSGTPALTRLDAQVNFNWAGGAPAAGMPVDLFSARWDGEIEARYTESLTLIARTDDGVRLWLNGQLVVDAWVLRGATDSTYTFTAVAGQRYRIRMEYYEHYGSAVAQLLWKSATIARAAIPTAYLYPTPAVEPASGSGTGLLARYYANETLSGTPVLARTDARVDFGWGGGSPGPGIPVDHFSARWDGEIEARVSEPLTIIARTDDGVRVWLDGNVVVDQWVPRSPADSTFTFSAEAGQRYRIRIEYFERTGSAVARLYWQSATEPKAPIPTCQLYPTDPLDPPNGTGTGLLASYYANETLSGPAVIERTDARVDFDWGAGSPGTGVPSNSFSARWLGEIEPRTSGPLTLIARTDDGVRLWCDDQLVIDQWILRGAADSTYTFTAQAGQHYRIRMEYFEHTGSAVAKLWWSSATEPRSPIPTTQLYPVAPPIPPAGTGTGLTASYFANETLAGTPVLSRLDPRVDFTWGAGSPGSPVPVDGFSARWEGEIQPRVAGSLTLIARTDDGVRLWLDDIQVINAWILRGAADSTYTFTAQAGRHYRIRMEYFEHTGSAVAKLWWQGTNEPKGPVPTSQLYPTGSQLLPTAPDTSGPIGTGTGLTGSYFTNETLSGVPAVSRIDAGVNFDWAGGSPASGIAADSFSARWTGDIQPRYSEPYTLILRTDDGVRVWLDGQMVINDWFLRGAANSTYTFNAEAGRRYRIQIEYYEHLGSAVAQLQWYSAREFSSPVPASQLYPLPVPEIVVTDVPYTLAEGETVSLSATVTNTGGAPVVYAWTQESGPAPVIFSPANAATTSLRFPTAGSYVLKGWAYNGHVTVSDTTTVTVVESDVASDLVAYYTFDESSGNVAYDSSGKQHTGTVIGASRTSGKSRGALRFTGTSYVYAAGNEDLDLPLPALTLAVWLKPDRTLAEMAHPWPMPIYRAEFETSRGYALMTTLSEADQFGLRLHHQEGFGERIESTTASPLTPGQWVHVAGVFDGTHATLYLDGVVVASVPTGPISVRNTSNAPLYLGYGFEGLMDDVRVYHRALSRTDVYGLAQDGSDRRVPGVDAGADQVVALPGTTVFAGSATDDAGSGSALRATWKQVAGPATAVIADRHSLLSPVNFTAAGSYRFQLEVSDGVLTGRDEMRIEVTTGVVDLGSGLVLYHPCDEGTGTVVGDASNNGHTGEFLYGAQWSQEGQPLSAVQLTGSNVIFTQSSSAIDNLGQMTLSLWIRADRALVDMAYPFPLAMYHADYENNRGFALMTTLNDTNLFGFRLHTGTGRREVVMDGLPTGQWAHVVATYDGQAMRLYRNGELVGLNVTGPLNVPSFVGPLNIGGGFEGLFDEIRIYNRALSPTEVQALHTLVPIGGSG
jgi:hypothetical protein